MPDIPAICNKCRLVFPSGFGGPGEIHATFVNCSSVCPRCGGIGTILDGVYHSIGDTVSLISHNPDQLRRLAEVVRQAQRGQHTYVDIQKEFEEVAPGLGKFLPKNATELQGYLKLLLQVLVIIVGLHAANKYSATNIPAHVDTATQRMYDEAVPKVSMRPIAKKVGRNKPCPCGSGMKYKRCCGSPGARGNCD